MRFADLVTRAPIPFDPARGAEARARYCGLGEAFEALVEGAAGCAPHLARLLESEAEWMLGAAAGSAEAALEDCLAGLEGAALPELGARLREAKRRVGLLTALADLGGVWDLDAVTGALSDLADAALARGVAALVAEAQGQGLLPEVEAADGGLFVIAMGKLGARELNYSSDIDLIGLFDEALYPAEDYPEIRKRFIRITQRLVKLISEVTGGGYVFRTDLRLRPDPSVTPVCIGMGAAERYYEAQGRTWERAAFIRARVAAGDMDAGARFLNALTPFIWRRHLDFAAIADAHDMRLRIREHKGLGGRLELPGHDVKLGRGGIREIEFFTQTRQLICGGRDPSLRVSRTVPALAALAQAGWIPAHVAATFSEAYVAHRTLEHRLQMLEDAQTHRFPASEINRDRLAAFCGAAEREAFEATELARFEAVHGLAETFFAPGGGGGEEDVWSRFPEPERTREVVDGWQGLPALRSDRARRIFRRLAPKIAERLSGAARPDFALTQFDSFIRGLPAGVQVFSLFEANPQILDLMIDICATAPRLAGYLGRNAGVLDAVLAREFFEPLPGLNALTDELAARLEAGDYETKLDAARIWAREQSFRIGVQLLRRIATPSEAGEEYSDVAEAVLRAMLPVVTAEHARRHGAPPGGGAAVLGMGKLGSREMTAGSDLDLIVIYDAAADALSEGPKPLAAPAYYARLTQAFIAALTVPTSQGALYEVDMRLRPSGRQGPVATSLAGFARYQREDAWTWEHMALTRARVVAGPDALAAGIAAAVAEARAAPRDPAKVLADVREMRARIRDAKGAEAADPWEVKAGPGRLLDIELAAQAGAVLHPAITAHAPREMLVALAGTGWIGQDAAGALLGELDRLSAVQQYARLALETGFSAEKGGPGLAALVAQAAGAEGLDDLARRLAEGAAEADRIITGLLSGDGG